LSVQTTDGKTALLAVRDPAHLGVGGGETSISCGLQKTARRVTVQYIAQPDKKLGTIGDATII
jgi:hypothetical protein